MGKHIGRNVCYEGVASNKPVIHARNLRDSQTLLFVTVGVGTTFCTKCVGVLTD